MRQRVPGPRLCRAVAVMVGFCLVICSAGAAIQNPATEAFAPNHVLIRFNAQAQPFVVKGPPEVALRRVQSQLRLPAGCVLEEPFVTRIRREQRAARDLNRAFPALDLNTFFYLRLPPGLSVDACIGRLQNHPLVEYVEPDGIGRGGALVPDDPNFGSQYHHRNQTKPGADISTPLAWDITTGSTNVTVAVLDTGLDLSLAEFAGRLVPGYDFVNNDDDPTDDNGHGTAVTGVLAATGNNGQLLAGVDWQCRIMPLKVLDSGNSGFYSDWAQAVDYAVMNDCKVINLSAGGLSSNTTLATAIRNAIAQGVIFVTITHNDNSAIIRFPGNLFEVISVGGTDALDQRYSLSNYGVQIDLVAPGQSILTTSRGGGVSTWSGTSFSAPMVAGVCALMAGMNMDITHEEAALYLTLGAEDEVGDATDTPGFDPYYGWGRMNAYRSLQLSDAPFSPLAISQADISGPVSTGCAVTYEFKVANNTFGSATGVVVTNTLPEGVEFQSAASSQGAHFLLGRDLIFSLGEMAARQQVDLTVTLVPTTAGEVINRAVVHSDQVTFDAEFHETIQVVMVEEDLVGPLVMSAQASSDGRMILAVISEPLAEGSLVDSGMVSLWDGFLQPVTVTGATLESDRHSVRLETSMVGRPGPFLLSLEGMLDCSGNEGAAGVMVAVARPPWILVEAGSNWRYWDTGTPPDTNWVALEFDDTSWNSGPAELGYGDGDETTVVSYGGDPNNKNITTYFRHAFEIESVLSVTNLRVRLRRDDGGVVYLNGSEILRSNLPEENLAPDTLALTSMTGIEEVDYIEAISDASLLRDGANMVAVEIHQASLDSSDLSFDLEMLVESGELPDADGDRIPDFWELRHGLNPGAGEDAESDLDNDTQSARAEYLAGTDPNDDTSLFRIERVTRELNQVVLEFLAVSNRSYSVLYRESISTGPWLELETLYPLSTSRWHRVVEEPGTSSERYYRLIAPRYP